MFIRFVSGEIDSDSHIETGLFYAAYKLKYEYDLPEYELDRLQELLGWFNNNLNSPLELSELKTRLARHGRELSPLLVAIYIFRFEPKLWNSGRAGQ